jgi:integrase/recombinase XerD
MAYTIKPYLQASSNDTDLHKLAIRVVFNRMHAYKSTEFKLRKDQLQGREVINHPHKAKITNLLNKIILDIEENLLELMSLPGVSLDMLKKAVNGERSSKQTLTDFINTYMSEMKGKKSNNTIEVYEDVNNDLIDYDPYLYLNKISISWLNTFEQHLRGKGLHSNTVHKKMKNIKGFLKQASNRGLIKVEKYQQYKVPVYENPLPEYLSEDEIALFKNVCDCIQRPMMKMSGYYFLLSCYAGFRISDLKKFNYFQMVSNNRILLKAKKNKSIISIPIHTRLGDVLSYCKENPLTISEQNMRDYVKDISKMAGVDRKIKVHTARHSFAMMLMDNGFDLEEVAELLGVTMKTASIYARISNKRLEKKVLDRLC